MKVYLIEKSSGLYDDYYSYVDNGFFSKSKAEEYIQNYNNQLYHDCIQGDECDKCCHGKYQNLSQVIHNCKLGANKIDISDINKLNRNIWFDCEKQVDSYYIKEVHPAKIKDIEVE